MNLTTVRNGLKSRMDTVTGLSAFARMPGNIDPPAAVVYPGKPLYSVESMGMGVTRINFLVTLYSPIGSDWDNAQLILDGYLSHPNDPTISVVDALYSHTTVSDATLGGALHISSVGDSYDIVQYGDNSPLSLSADINLYLAI